MNTYGKSWIGQLKQLIFFDARLCDRLALALWAHALRHGPRGGDDIQRQAFVATLHLKRWPVPGCKAADSSHHLAHVADL